MFYAVAGSSLIAQPPHRKPHKPCRLRATASIPAAISRSAILSRTSDILNQFMITGFVTF